MTDRPRRPENSRRKQDGKFRKGKSGNPAGKPMGARNYVTRLAEQLIDGQAEAIIQKAVAMALAGDGMALRALLDRLVPPRRERPIEIELPVINTAGDAVAAGAAIAAAAADGMITPSEASAMSTLIANIARTIEITQLDARVAALEEARNAKQA